MPAPNRFIAVDWSGNASPGGQRKHLWVADLNDSESTLTANRTREEVISWLIETALAGTKNVVIGLDFAFSFPSPFLKKHRLRSAADLWALAGRQGERWLASCEPPFWGRPGKSCPGTHPVEGFRATDLSINVRGISPKSVFQIGGAGAVGTGTIRGLPFLRQLSEAGFSIWPFDPPAYPLVLEIYPRLLTGPVRKSQLAARREYLRRPEFADLPAKLTGPATVSEDAFDALVSALAMKRHAGDLAALQQLANFPESLEGCIWQPARGL